MIEYEAEGRVRYTAAIDRVNPKRIRLFSDWKRESSLDHISDYHWQHEFEKDSFYQNMTQNMTQDTEHDTGMSNV